MTTAEFEAKVVDQRFPVQGGSGSGAFTIDADGTIFVNDGCNDSQYSPWEFADGTLRLAEGYEGFGTERGCPEGQHVSALPVGAWGVVGEGEAGLEVQILLEDGQVIELVLP